VKVILLLVDLPSKKVPPDLDNFRNGESTEKARDLYLAGGDESGNCKSSGGSRRVR